MDNLRDIPPETGTDFTPTARLGPYLLQRELGRGFSSVVYAGWDGQRRRAVAVKALTFLQPLSENRRLDLIQRFRREAQAISALSHPNIVAVLDFGQAPDGRQFIAMESLRGETLRCRLLRSGPLPVSHAAAIAIGIADALHYAHGRGIIHRDVKPDNVFLAEASDDPAGTPKLMDFGIARVLSDQAMTQDGTIVGSPAYMSPEQIQGGALDARTDVFSLAVMLTEMTAGLKPFEADTIPAVMQRILHRPPDLSGVADRPLRRVLAKALAKNPNRRYSDAASFADALRQAVPLAAPTPSVATQVIAIAPSPPRLARPLPFPLTFALPLALGSLVLALLAALPLLAPRSAPATVDTVHAASRRVPRPLMPPPAPSRRAAASLPEQRFLVHYTPTFADSARPRRHLATISPAPPAAPQAPAAPLAPLPPAVPVQPPVRPPLSR